MTVEKEAFFLDTENGTMECEIVQKLYFDKYQKDYLVYTIKNDEENIFISAIEKKDEDCELVDITDSKELKEVSDYLDFIWETEV